jgi:hypothetical protein
MERSFKKMDMPLQKFRIRVIEKDSNRLLRTANMEFPPRTIGRKRMLELIDEYAWNVAWANNLRRWDVFFRIYGITNTGEERIHLATEERPTKRRLDIAEMMELELAGLEMN